MMRAAPNLPHPAPRALARAARHGRGAALWALFLAVAVAVAQQAAPLTWRLADPSTGPALMAAPTAPAAPAPTDLGPIRALAPFGAAATPAAEAAPTPDTALGLALAGVVVAPDAARSSAVIAVGAAPPARFAIGERVGPRAVLTRVEPGEVLLDVDGASERLRFPETGRSRATEAARAVIPGLAAAPAADPVERWRRRIDDNPAAVLRELGLEASGSGYRVGVGGDPGVRRAGLRPGDVVARVNGRAVGDVARDRALIAEVLAEGRARVEVVRGGRTITLSFPLR